MLPHCGHEAEPFQQFAQSLNTTTTKTFFFFFFAQVSVMLIPYTHFPKTYMTFTSIIFFFFLSPLLYFKIWLLHVSFHLFFFSVAGRSREARFDLTGFCYTSICSIHIFPIFVFRPVLLSRS